MSAVTTLPSIDVPKLPWSSNYSDVVKIVINGSEAFNFPNDQLKKCLIDEKIIRYSDDDQVDILVLESKRKRFLYAKRLDFYHRQIVEVEFNSQKLTLLLLNPNNTMTEVTLLHMPIETNQVVIREIFKSMNSEWDTWCEKRSPGAQMRSDRWELLLDCKEEEDAIPEGFILPKMSPDKQDIHVKIFVRGRPPKQIARKSKDHHSSTPPDKVTTPQPPTPPPVQTPLAPPPPTTAHDVTPLSHTPTSTTHATVGSSTQCYTRPTCTPWTEGPAHRDTRDRPSPSPNEKRPEPKRGKKDET